jgi:glycosyl transferase family 87
MAPGPGRVLILNRRRLRLWGLTLLVLGWGVHLHTISTAGLIDRAGRVKGSDYVQFYVMGSLAAAGRFEALYDANAHLAEGRQRIDPALGIYASHPDYGPQVALAFAPLAAVPYATSLAIFTALIASIYAFSVWILWRECPALRVDGALVGLLAAASPLFLTVVRYGQASAFALLAVSLGYAALRRERHFLAGLAIGCLAYKPQLGIVIAAAAIGARQWRLVAGAAFAAGAQIAIGWFAGGTAVVAAYVRELAALAMNPSLVQLHPSEVHSIRGLVQLLVPYAPIVTFAALIALVIGIVAAVRGWSAPGPLGMQWSLLVTLTILASPHLLTYDLVLLTVPLLLIADWTVDNSDHPSSAPIRVLLALLYFAPFSAMIVARLTGIQVSTIAMALLAWYAYQISTESRAIVAPRWELVSSQNSTTRGWRSSAA